MTKLDNFLTKLIDLTVQGLIPWVEIKGNYDYPIAFKADTPEGLIEYVLMPSDLRGLKLSSNSREYEYTFYQEESPFLPELSRAIKEFLYIPWQVEVVMKNIVEGALDEREGMDNAV